MTLLVITLKRVQFPVSLCPEASSLSDRDLSTFVFESFGGSRWGKPMAVNRLKHLAVKRKNWQTLTHSRKKRSPKKKILISTMECYLS